MKFDDHVRRSGGPVGSRCCRGRRGSFVARFDQVSSRPCSKDDSDPTRTLRRSVIVDPGRSWSPQMSRNHSRTSRYCTICVAMAGKARLIARTLPRHARGLGAGGKWG